MAVWKTRIPNHPRGFAVDATQVDPSRAALESPISVEAGKRSLVAAGLAAGVERAAVRLEKGWSLTVGAGNGVIRTWSMKVRFVFIPFFAASTFYPECHARLTGKNLLSWGITRFRSRQPYMKYGRAIWGALGIALATDMPRP
jgi:hypothetical protein